MLGSLRYKMKDLYEQSKILAGNAQEIVDQLALHNPGMSTEPKKVPLNTIAHSIATLMRDLSILWTDLNQRFLREENDS